MKNGGACFSLPAGPSAPPPTASTNYGPPASRNADDARNAFDKLFKKL